MGPGEDRAIPGRGERGQVRLIPNGAWGGQVRLILNGAWGGQGKAWEAGERTGKTHT